MINYKYTLSMLKRDPIQLAKELIIDFNKDFVLKKFDISNYVWCIGLPKSGSTIVEKILDQLQYVQANKSVLRSYDLKNILEDDQITVEQFNCFPKKKIYIL